MISCSCLVEDTFGYNEGPTHIKNISLLAGTSYLNDSLYFIILLLHLLLLHAVCTIWVSAAGCTTNCPGA